MVQGPGNVSTHRRFFVEDPPLAVTAPPPRDVPAILPTTSPSARPTVTTAADARASLRSDPTTQQFRAWIEQKVAHTGPLAAGQTVETTAPLHVRSTPQYRGDGSNTVGTFAAGARLTVVPDANGQTEQNGWVRVRGTTHDGRNVTGWVSKGYVRATDGASPTNPTTPPPPAPPSGNGQYLDRNGQPQNFIGGNYTDLGMQDGVFSKTAAANDLDRLAAQGVDEVRVWANGIPGMSADADPQAMAARVDTLARLADERGISLTVDLFDGKDRNVAEYRAEDGKINSFIDTVVGQNAHHANIKWSLGNEIRDHENPAAFASWYEEKVGRMRNVGARHVTAQLIPGSVHHPFPGTEAEAAARRVIRASDSVSVHFYANGALPEAANDLEYQSLLQWKRLADEANKPLTIGEFNIKKSSGQRNGPALDAWLGHLHGLGIDHVSLWQFMKDEGGHIDEESWSQLPGNDQAYLSDIARWLGIPPR